MGSNVSREGACGHAPPPPPPPPPDTSFDMYLDNCVVTMAYPSLKSWLRYWPWALVNDQADSPLSSGLSM